MTTLTFKSERISRTGVITLNAPLGKVFPLFGALREKEWAPDWQPEVIYATDGSIEERMVFKTQSHHEQEPDSTWIVAQYRPEQSFIEYIVFAPERVWWITIQCHEGVVGETTEATITYTYTGLSEDGNAKNAQALEMMFRHDLKDWEDQINQYLAIEKLKDPC
jgi:hypothetical protein